MRWRFRWDPSMLAPRTLRLYTRNTLCSLRRWRHSSYVVRAHDACLITVLLLVSPFVIISFSLFLLLLSCWNLTPCRFDYCWGARRSKSNINISRKTEISPKHPGTLPPSIDWLLNLVFGKLVTPASMVCCVQIFSKSFTSWLHLYNLQA